MRPRFSQHVHPVVHLLVVLLVPIALLLLSIGWEQPEPVEARPAPAVSTPAGGAFGNAVPCLGGPDTFVTARGANNLYFPSGSRLSQGQANSLPAVQTVTAAGPTLTLADLGRVGAIYGLAYDDGRASGRERLFAAAFTKRLVDYGPAGGGGIYVFQRIGTGWSLLGSFQVPGAVSAFHSGIGSSDRALAAQVGKTSLGDIEISPDGRSLYVVNIGPKRIERFDLTSGAIPAHQGAIPINLGRITPDATTQADLWPFALEFYPFPNRHTSDQQQLVIGVTDSAERGIVGGRPLMSGQHFRVSPQAHVLVYNLATGFWWKDLSQDLGNSPTFNARHFGSTYGDYGDWNTVPGNYLVKGWNPWRGDPGTMAGRGPSIYYPQPWLTDIEFLSFQPAPGAPAWDTPYMVLGLRDRTGDQVFNASLSTGGVPAGEHIATAQGDTLYYRHTGGGWAFQSGEAFDDNTHAGGPNAHIENHTGALASVLNDRASVSATGEALATTSLGGLGTQELRIFNRAAGPGASGAPSSRPQLIGIDTHAATKASNLGDLEVLCSYALVGGRVWNDSLYNGVQDAGEAGIGGVTLEVFDNRGLPVPATAPALAIATTDAQGRYLFAVPPNTAVGIRIAQGSRTSLVAQGYRTYTPQGRGGDDTRDSDLDPFWGFVEFAPAGNRRTSQAITPLWREGEGRSFDIGLRRALGTASVGDRVWIDGDADGVQGAGESGLPGVGITLESSGEAAALDAVNHATSTDAAGSYRFRDLAPGVYRVRFSPPAGMQATARDRGGDDTRDSDADAASGYATDFFVLADGQIETTRDLGLIAGADVAIRKSGPATVAAGGALRYTLTVENRSASPALGVVVDDMLPDSLSFGAANLPPTSRSGQALRWELGDLAGNTSRTITLDVFAPVSFTPVEAVTQVVENCASVTSTSPDNNPGNNRACAGTAVQRPEVSILKTDAPDPVLVGDELSYTLTFSNSGSLTASGVNVDDILHASLAFERFSDNPLGCSYRVTGSQRVVRCPGLSLAPGERGSVTFVVRPLAPTTGTRAGNQGRIATITPGDLRTNNSSIAWTELLFPNPRVSLAIDPRPLPVGEPGRIVAGYRNGGTGLARSTVLTITHDPGAEVGSVPAGCAYTLATRQAVCDLGDLAAGATGTLTLPLRLPATPLDAASFAGDAFGATAEIQTVTPERAGDRADNSASAGVDVARPNVYVTAGGPDGTVRLTWGSGFVYTVDYGNAYRANPGLTRAAETSVLTVTLPADVDFLDASVPPTRVSGQVLVWELDTLAPRATGSLRIAVRTDVPAGTLLHMEADIGTITPGDDPRDNHAEVDTTVVRPPDTIPAVDGSLRLAIHSDLDPRHGGADPSDGVYLTEAGASRIAWPGGEVLDFTPRLDRYTLEPLGWPLEHRARVTGWSVQSFTGNGREVAATAADSRGIAGCRGAGAPPSGGSRLTGCAYSYVGAHGEGRTIDDFLPAASALREADMASQAHVYWTQPPAPPMRPDVYLYTLAPLEPPRLSVAVEVEVWVVNACPDFLIDPLGACGVPVEMPVPGRVRQAVGGAFDVTLVVPRSVVGPAGVGP